MTADIASVEGRVALVTGAGQGVGRMIALELANHGARGIVVNDFYAERAHAVAAEVDDDGVAALAAAADVGDAEAVAEMVATAEERFGGIDILVNNAGNDGPAGSAREVPFWESAPSDWDPWIRVNLHGVLHCTRYALPGMIARQHGRVVTVISDAGRVGEAHLPVYSGAKAAAAGFTRALAKAVGRHGVTANAVSLGVTRTPSTERFLDDAGVQEKILRSYAIRRVGEPLDVARLVVFLASESGSWITGQTYPVNGGYSFAM